MKNLTQELLSFDQTLYKKRALVLEKVKNTRKDVEDEYEKFFSLKKKEFNDIKIKEEKELQDYCESISRKKDEHFAELKNKFKEDEKLALHVKDIVAFIKKDLCTKKRF